MISSIILGEWEGDWLGISNIRKDFWWGEFGGKKKGKGFCLPHFIRFYLHQGWKEGFLLDEFKQKEGFLVGAIQTEGRVFVYPTLFVFTYIKDGVDIELTGIYWLFFVIRLGYLWVMKVWFLLFSLEDGRIFDWVKSKRKEGFLIGWIQTKGRVFVYLAFFVFT